MQAKLRDSGATLQARDAEVAALQSDLAAARGKAAERDRLVEERAQLDSVGRLQADLLTSQAAEVSQLSATVAMLEQQLAAARNQVDTLRVQSRGSSSLQALAGRPCLLTRRFHKLTGAVPTGITHAACCALGHHWLVLHAWTDAGQAGDHAGHPRTYALHVPTSTWHLLPQHLSAARKGMALVQVSECDPSCGAASALFLMGGVKTGDSSAEQLSDAAVLLVSDIAASLKEDASLILPPHWAPPTAAHAHCAREGASACSSGDGTLFLVGGSLPSDSAAVAACGARNPHAASWLPAPAGATGQLAPSPRIRACVAVSADGTRLWLFGGIAVGSPDDERRRLNDLFSYNVATRRWTSHEAAPGPSPCGRDSGSLCVLSPDFVVLAGGCTDDSGSPAPDMWALHVPSMTWQCIIPAPPPSDEPHVCCSGALACHPATGELHVLHTRSSPGGEPAWDVLETVQLTLPDAMDDIVTSATAEAVASAEAFTEGSSTLRLWLHAAGSTSLELRWRPPVRNAERITSYTLMMTPGGSTVSKAWYRGLGEWTTIAGLKTGWEYIFSLKATYDDGSHIWSDTVAFHTRRAAGSDELHPAAPRPRGKVLQPGEVPLMPT